MQLNTSWKSADVGTVAYNGKNYLYSLLYDYELYVKYFGVIPLISFIKEWTCIPLENFTRLRIGDVVYSATGDSYAVVDTPYESDDETCYYVEVRELDKNLKFLDVPTDIFTSGDIYYKPVTHEHHLYKKIRKTESEEKICPILITKTNQPQS